MKTVLFLLFTFSSVFGQHQFVPWRRISKTELYFYNGIDGKIENGWTDADSTGVVITHNTALSAGEGGPAEGLAKLKFGATGGDWRIRATDGGYNASHTDEVVMRVRTDQPATDLTFYAVGFENPAEVVKFQFSATPGWKQIHIPWKAVVDPVRVQQVGLRSAGKSDVFVAHMYLKVRE